MKKIIWPVLLIFFLMTFALKTFSAQNIQAFFINNPVIDKEIRFLELRAKKEMADKRNSTLKRYTIAILMAREFKLIGLSHKSLEFYRLAQDIKININRREIKLALKENKLDMNRKQKSPFYFKTNLKELIVKKSYEKAILAINPEILNENTNEIKELKIIYDLLQVKIKKQHVKKLYCIDHSQNDLDSTNYETVLCDFLNEYLKEGKKNKAYRNYLSYLDDYFLKTNINERYLLNLIHDI